MVDRELLTRASEGARWSPLTALHRVLARVGIIVIECVVANDFFVQITYLNSVVMPDEAESESEENEDEEGEDDDDDDGAESSGAGDDDEAE